MPTSSQNLPKLSGNILSNRVTVIARSRPKGGDVAIRIPLLRWWRNNLYKENGLPHQCAHWFAMTVVVDGLLQPTDILPTVTFGTSDARRMAGTYAVSIYFFLFRMRSQR